MAGFEKLVAGRGRHVGPAIERQQDSLGGHPQADSPASSGQLVDEQGEPIGSLREAGATPPEEEVTEEVTVRPLPRRQPARP